MLPFFVQKEGVCVALTAKQKRFVEEYLIDLNATQAALRTGYSSKTAYSIGQKLLKKVEIQSYIKEQLEHIRSEKTADTQEVMEYLTAVMRGENLSEEIVTVGVGDGMSEVTKVNKRPSERDKLKAAELLGKRFGMFNAEKSIQTGKEVIIIDDIKCTTE